MATATTIKTTMKAVRIHSFGGPDVLRLEETPRPEPQHDQLLVRVHAAGVNPVDWKIREGRFDGLGLPAVLGRDFSGVVEAAGADVRNFRVGEEVFGEAAGGSGSYAEYTVAQESQIARKPPALEHVQAAALPVAALTAWQAMFDMADLRAGQKVLIHAAAGGVGSFAVQFAKRAGAYVIGTASSANSAYLGELGVSQFIDYQTTWFEDIVRDVDLVFDTMGGEIQDRSWRVLKRGGMLVSIVGPPSPEKAAAQGVRGIYFRQNPRGDQMAEIADLVAVGQVKVRVVRVFALGEARRAHELSQSGHIAGKIVLAID